MVSLSHTGHHPANVSRLLLDISAAETKRGTALLKEAAVNQLRYVSETATLTDPE